VGALAADGRRAYVAPVGAEESSPGLSAGLIVLDIGTPAAPRVLGQRLDKTLGRVTRVVRLDEETAFLASNVGLYLWDVSDPRRPTELARLGPEIDDEPNYPWVSGVALRGDLVYVADAAAVEPHLPGIAVLRWTAR
jgi:hypothetical protein